MRSDPLSLSDFSSRRIKTTNAGYNIASIVRKNRVCLAVGCLLVCYLIGQYKLPIFNCVQGKFRVLSFHTAHTGFPPPVRKYFDMPSLTLYKIITNLNE